MLQKRFRIVYEFVNIVLLTLFLFKIPQILLKERHISMCFEHFCSKYTQIQRNRHNTEQKQSGCNIKCGAKDITLYKEITQGCRIKISQ